MSTSYSIVEARNNFAALVRDAEASKQPINVTRRGESVAVILSQDEYMRLLKAQPEKTPYEAIMEWREKWDVANMALDPDEIWGDVRDKTPAPDKSIWE